MKAIEVGHKYELQNVDADSVQTLTFIKRENGELIHDGTTNEEVIAMLLDRMEELEVKLPCFENKRAIQALEMALKWLDARTKRRVAQGVETTDQPHDSVAPVDETEIEKGETETANGETGDGSQA